MIRQARSLRSLKELLPKESLVADAHATSFLISIPDAGEDWQNEIEKLLDIYLLAVYDHMRLDLKKRQNLIMVFSKADELLQGPPQRQLSSELAHYLADVGSYGHYNQMEEKLKELRLVSQGVRSWLQAKGGVGLIKTCEAYFKSVEYTLYLL